jgi:hypothetical protein
MGDALVSDNLIGLKLSRTIHGPKDASGRRDELLHAGKKITAAVFQQLQKLEVEEIEIGEGDLEGAFAVSDVVNPRTGEVILEANEPLTPSAVAANQDVESQVGSFEVFFEGKSLYTANDATITGGGRVALWTKSDSVTHFDDLRIIPLP